MNRKLETWFNENEVTNSEARQVYRQAIGKPLSQDTVQGLLADYEDEQVTYDVDFTSILNQCLTFKDNPADLSNAIGISGLMTIYVSEDLQGWIIND